MAHMEGCQDDGHLVDTLHIKGHNNENPLERPSF